MAHLIPHTFVLQALSFAVLLSSSTLFGGAPLASNTTKAIPEQGAPKAFAFDLNQVQLLDSPFKVAQTNVRNYLMKLEVDQFLYPFRREAGLPSPIKGSDSYGYRSTGHYLGHYLSACALMYRNTGDEELKKRADEAVAVLAKCQQQIGTGFVMGFSEKAMLSFIETGALGSAKDPKALVVPWYCLHKVYAGLLDMHVLTGNRQALNVLESAVGWLDKQMAPISGKRLDVLVSSELGGLNEMLTDLYAVTGKEEYLSLARKFKHQDLFAAFEINEDPLDFRHANARIGMFSGSARQAILTGEPALRKIADNFWTTVTQYRSYATGGNSAAEHFSRKNWLPYAMQLTSETCNSYNMLKLTRNLFRLDAGPARADYFERTLYNHILSAQHPQTGGMLYFQLLGTGEPKTHNWSKPNSHTECCFGTGLESHSKYAESIYFHDGSDMLYINLFIPSELDWKAKGLTVRQETGYPEEGSTQLHFASQKPVVVSVKIRRPWWATTDFQIKVNGDPQKISSTPSSYVTLERTWKNGDKVEVLMPMGLHTEPFRDNPRRLALMYGPMVLASKTQLNNRFSAIRANGDDFLKSLQRVPGKPLEFTAPAEVFHTSPLTVGSEPVSFQPLLRMVDEPKVVYWDRFNEQEFTACGNIFQAEAERHRQLDPTTVDLVLCGMNQKMLVEDGGFTFQALLFGPDGLKSILPRTLETVMEDSHGAKIENADRINWKTNLYPNGIFHAFRFIPSSSVVGYQMRVLPDQEQQLQVRLWRPQYDRTGFQAKRSGSFEVLVDDTSVGNCKVEVLPYDQFVDLSFTIPVALTQGKSQVQVAFKNGTKGEDALVGFYECRVQRTGQ